MQQKKIPRQFQSMLLQTVSMCLWYNPVLTFQFFEQNNATLAYFTKLH